MDNSSSQGDLVAGDLLIWSDHTAIFTGTGFLVNSEGADAELTNIDLREAMTGSPDSAARVQKIGRFLGNLKRIRRLKSYT